MTRLNPNPRPAETVTFDTLVKAFPSSLLGIDWNAPEQISGAFEVEDFVSDNYGQVLYVVRDGEEWAIMGEDLPE